MIWTDIQPFFLEKIHPVVVVVNVRTIHVKITGLCATAMAFGCQMVSLQKKRELLSIISGQSGHTELWHDDGFLQQLWPNLRIIALHS